MTRLADTERGLTWSRVQALLSNLEDTELAELLRTASEVGTGIGGRTLHLDVNGTSVFVKAVSLTAMETHADKLRSTANLFGLPTYCQYNVGSPGFNAWRSRRRPAQHRGSHAVKRTQDAAPLRRRASRSTAQPSAGGLPSAREE